MGVLNLGVLYPFNFEQGRKDTYWYWYCGIKHDRPVELNTASNEMKGN